MRVPKEYPFKKRTLEEIKDDIGEQLKRADVGKEISVEDFRAMLSNFKELVINVENLESFAYGGYPKNIKISFYKALSPFYYVISALFLLSGFITLYFFRSSISIMTSILGIIFGLVILVFLLMLKRG